MKYLIIAAYVLSAFGMPANACAEQNKPVELAVDVSATTIALPAVYKPGLDISGRGFHRDTTWPQSLAGRQALDMWDQKIGFKGMYRLQYDLWDIYQLDKAKDAQRKLRDTYEEQIRRVSDAGGIVLLNLFGTPPGLGRVLDKRSPPRDLKAYKAIVKEVIRHLSCEQRYNIWYEVWNAPDLSEFFLGRKQEYYLLYKTVASAARELENETKIHIPIGAPSISWWFQAPEGNTVMTPEESLLYGLIKYCYRYRVPLNFISWHSFSCDPLVEAERTRYKQSALNLIRNWLSFFRFSETTPIIIDEWNFDRSSNVLAERSERAYVAASYIPSRLAGMRSQGIGYQTFYSLEDFQNNKEGVTRNVGVFSFAASGADYASSPRAQFNVFQMLSLLGSRMYDVKIEDDFVGAVVTREGDSLRILFHNYIDPEIALNYVSRSIAELSAGERKITLGLIRSGVFNELMSGKKDIASVRAGGRVKSLLKKAQTYYNQAQEALSHERNLLLSLKNFTGEYRRQLYAVDSMCSKSCAFAPIEQSDIAPQGLYQEELTLKPYSVYLVVLEPKVSASVSDASVEAALSSVEATNGQEDN